MDAHFGFERRDDVAGVLATLAPEAEHDIVGWPGGPTVGAENARPFYESLFADLAEGAATSVRRLHGENFLVDESVWRGKAVGQPFGLDGRGRRLEFRMLHVVEFDGEQIRREQVWVDLAAVLRQLPQD
jgi:ketosteroid isomerase-like protein